MGNIVTYSSKAVALRGIARMGMTDKDQASQFAFQDNDGKWNVDRSAVEAALGLAGLTEEQENNKLACGHAFCPNVDCKIDLQNGWCDFDAMVDTHGSEKAAYKHMQREYMCLACNHQWGDEITPTNAKAPKPEGGTSSTKGRAYTNREKSTVDSPVAIVWGLADADTSAKRKDIVEKAIALGVTPNTAKTQYQYWRKARGLVKEA